MKSNKYSLYQTLWELSVNRKDLQALTLLGPTQNNPVLDPLAVLHHDNQLYISTQSIKDNEQCMYLNILPPEDVARFAVLLTNMISFSISETNFCFNLYNQQVRFKTDFKTLGWECYL